MAVSQTDVDALNSAIASGVRSVTLGGQTVIYNTTASLIQARDDLAKQLLAQTQAAPRLRQSYAYFAGRDYE